MKTESCLVAAMMATAVAIISVGSPPVASSPLHPDLLQDAGVMISVPPEPQLNYPRTPGVLNAAAPYGRRWTGHPRLLVLMVDFSDRPAEPETYSAAHFRRLLFSVQDLEFGSMRDWYLEATHDRIDLDGDIFGWYRMPRPYNDYTADLSGLCSGCFPNNARALAADAVLAAESAGVDFTQFDNDGPDGIPGSGDDDGILDGLVVVFAGQGAERTGLVSDIRSHYWNMTAVTAAGSVGIPDYVMIPEKENVGVAVHEVGHLLGGEDLYDQSGRGGGVGYYSVMGHGTWFGNGLQPGGPDPYTRMLWGVIQPEVLTVDEPLLEIPRINDEPYVLKLWKWGEIGPEYFLVENRKGEGIDRFLEEEGLLVYHVDERVARQDNPDRYRVAVVQADGLGSLDGNLPRNLGEHGDWFPGLVDVRALDESTNPSTMSNDGLPSLVALQNISDPAPVMTAAVSVGVPVGSTPDLRLAIMPESVSPGNVSTGESVSVQVRLENRGSRLSAGRLRFISRDPRVELLTPWEEDMPDLAARGSILLDRPVRLRVAASESRTPVPLEAVWETGSHSYRAVAVLPLDQTIVIHEGFEGGLLNPASALLGGGTDPWRRQSKRVHQGAWAWGATGDEGYPASVDAVLELGPIPLTGFSELRFRQWVDTKAFGDLSSDGGFLEASFDGGANWSLLTPHAGYPSRFELVEGNPYPDHPAWGGVRLEWEDVVVPLPPVSEPGTMMLRFHFVSSFRGGVGTYMGWFVDDLVIRSWDAPYAAVFEPPDMSGPHPKISFSVLPVLSHREPQILELERLAGTALTALGSWSVGPWFGAGVSVPDLDPGETHCFWLRWQNGPRAFDTPLVLTLPGSSPANLFAGSPELLKRGGEAMITYVVPGSAPTRVRLEVFDLRGRPVARMVDRVEHPGPHQVRWPSTDKNGRSFPAGVYFLRLSADNKEGTHSVVVLP